ncbi:MAG: MFS transporter [Candidatus Limnocylindrales bacterium]
MPPRLADAIRPAIGALRTTLGDASLRQLMVAWFTIIAGKWALLVATLVLAYALGGPVAVGVLGLARYLTPAIMAPFAGLPAARWPIEVVLRATNAIRTLAAVAAVVVVAIDAPFAVLALVVAIEAGVGAFSRPLHMALLPAVARTPDQLIAANVTSSAAEGLGTFVGPAAAGLLLVATGPLGALLAVVAVYAVGLTAIAPLHVPAVGRAERAAVGARAAFGQLASGIAAAVRLPGPRLVIVCLGLQTLVRGLLTVLIVVASIELLGLGEPGVGTLNAAMGLGGLLGAIVAITLAGRARLGPAFTVALAGWGAPIALIGLVVHPAVAIAAMLLVGVSNALLDVSGFTIAQRTTPNAARVAVLGVIDSVANLGPALGGIMAPVLLGALGTQGALIFTGAILPVAALVAWPAMRRLDEGGPTAARRVELIRAQPLFVPLSLATVEHLAARLVPMAVEDGAWIMREGDPGESYVLVARGEVEVSQGGRVLRTLGPGAGVGEIALLHDVPRTASVRALGPVEAFTLDHASFLEAVTGHAVSHAAAEATAAERLAGDAAS